MPDKENIPQHIAIIMDGNGRWAKEKRLPRTAGHREGVNRVKEIIKAAREAGVKVLTLFAFSAENWKRPKKEIDMLMRYLDNFLKTQAQELHKNNIRFKAIGQDEPLPQAIQNKIREVENKTRNNTGLTLVLALNYGSRQEIVDAAKKISDSILRGELKTENLDEDKFRDYLYTKELPDPDLLIRTSGEMRLSNFLLWQASYTEFYFPKKYWPDFGPQDLKAAIREYKRRQRKFGGIS